MATSVGFSTQQYFGFDPRTLPGCSLWLDAGDPDVFAFSSGSNISQWRDKSKINAVSNSASASSGTTTKVGNSVRLSSSLMTFQNPALFSGTTGTSFFITFASTNTNRQGHPIGLRHPTGSFGLNHLSFGDNNLYETIGSANRFNLGALFPGVINNVYTNIANRGGQTLIFRNGSQVFSGAYGNNYAGATQYGIGSVVTNNNDQYPYTGTLFEIIIYNRTLSLLEQQQVEGYLQWKWSSTRSLTFPSPTSFAGLQLWLDGADPSALFTDVSGTIPVGTSGNIGRWRDKSGSNRHYTQTTDSRRPSFANDTVTFSTTSQFLSNTANVTVGGIDVFAVVKPLPAAGNSWRTLLRGSAGEHPVIVNEGATQLGSFLNFGGFNQFGSLTLDGSARALLYVNIQGDRILRGALNGTLATSATVNAAAASTNFFALGNFADGFGNSGGQQWGDVNELILMTNTTTAQRQQIEGYLAWKWRLQSLLPSTHPYATPIVLPVSHPYYWNPPVMRIFQPIDLLQPPEFWFDAADLSTLTSSGNTFQTLQNKASTVVNNITVSTGTHTLTQAPNGLNLIRSPTSGRLVFTGAFPVQARSRFIAIRPIDNPATGGPIFLYQNFNTFNGHDTIGLSSNRLLTVAQGQIVQLLSVATTNQSNVLSAYTFLNADTTAGNRLAFNGSNLTLTNNFVAQQYFTGSANNFISGQGAQDLGEWISYNRGVSLGEAQQVEGYLAWKWGTQSRLPITHPYWAVTPSTPLFVPSQLSNLGLWLDAADFSSLSLVSGSNVSQWRDKSGNSLHATQSTSGNQPTYLSASNAIQFNGSSSFLRMNNSTLRPLNLYAVVKADSLAGSGTPAILSKFGEFGLYFTPTNAQTNVQAEYVNTSLALATISPANTASLTTRILQTTWDNVTASLLIDGQLRGSQTFAGPQRNKTTGAVQYRIGARYVSDDDASAPSSVWNGLMYEIIVFREGLTLTNRQKVEGYLAHKWGLQNNLPALHPFKKFRP